SYFFVLPTGQRDPQIRVTIPPMSTNNAPDTVSQGSNDTSMLPAISSIPVVPVVSAIFGATAVNGLVQTLRLAQPMTIALKTATIPIIQRPRLRVMDNAAPAAIVTSDMAVINGDASWPDNSTWLMWAASKPVAVTQVCVEPIRAIAPPSS